jgi:predicted DNA-binding protein
MVRSGLSEADAFKVERERISFWRRAGVSLANRTDGGEGYSGFVRPTGIRLSDTTKQKLSSARKGIKFSEEHRAKLAANKLGKPRKTFTAETIEKMRAASTAREAAKRRIFGENVRRTSRIKETAE